MMIIVIIIIKVNYINVNIYQFISLIQQLFQQIHFH